LRAEHVSESIDLLPRLHRGRRADAVATLVQLDPIMTCTALAAKPELAGIPVREVVSAMGPLTKPGTPLARRNAVLAYLHEQVYTHGCKDALVHDMHAALLAAGDDAAALHRRGPSNLDVPLAVIAGLPHTQCSVAMITLCASHRKI
jgi:hypothetical protein